MLGLFVEKLRLRTFVLIGNSIGGAVSVRYALGHPQQVRALVLCDSGGLRPPPDYATRLAIGAFVQFFAAGESGAPFEWAFDRYHQAVLREKPAEKSVRESFVPPMRLRLSSYRRRRVLRGARRVCGTRYLKSNVPTSWFL